VGQDEESWSVAYHVIPGDILRNEVWAALDEILLSTYGHESGQQMRVQAACIDSGYKDATVLRFTRDRYNRRVFATKGRSGAGTIWPHKPSRKNQTPFFMIGVNAAKDAIHDRLKVKETGASFCHFPLGRDLEYFEQLTAEKKFIRLSQRLREARMAQGDGARNESAGLPGLRLCGAEVAGAFRSQLNLFCDRFLKHGRRIAARRSRRHRKSKARSSRSRRRGGTPAPARGIHFSTGRAVASWAAAQVVRAVKPHGHHTCRPAGTARPTDMDDLSLCVEDDRRRTACRVHLHGGRSSKREPR